MLVLHLAVFGLGPEALLAFALFGAGSAFLWLRLPVDYPHTRFGACNAVTLLRAGLAACLLTPLLTPSPTGGSLEEWSIVLLALAALALDGVDGLLARRSGLLSAYGARFDMEVDAGLSLILTLHLLADDTLGPYVILLGIMRYVFIAASVPFPWLAAPLPERFGRKVVCVVQVAALIALQVPLLPVALAQWMAFGAVAALLWSFGRDTLWLWRHKT
ncbi:MAG: CDP-alcohol phosphatidyltransferase family protein [Rhodobacterales bacterium]